MARKKDIQLGQLLVQRRWCTLRQVNEALRRQRDLRAQSQLKPLGAILLEAKSVQEHDLCMALAELGALTLKCSRCQSRFKPQAYQPRSNPCPRCGAEAVLDRDGSPRPRGAAGAEGANSSNAACEAASSSSSGNRSLASGSRDLKDMVLGGCKIIEKIAQGGMGVVYKATQVNLGRTVALKVLSDELSSDATFVRRFLQEAHAAAQLNHPNMIHINDVGQEDGIYYFVMEYVDGLNLRDLLKKDQWLEVSRAMDITVQICHALRHAHTRGVIHRDIKPENIMITRDGIVKLADLGLAKRLDAEHCSSITHAGSILGTPFYMAPEQAKDFSKVDCRSDIYSLGVTLYRMLSGRVPFYGRSPVEVMIKAIEGKKTPIRELREDIPPAVEQLVDRMMERNPRDRFQDISEVLAALDRAARLLPVAGTSA
jgi:serine/threonine-protein kinase